MAKGRETITVIRKAKVDKLKPKSTEETRFEVKHCSVLPRASEEAEGGWVQIKGYTVYAPGGSDIREDDQVICRGETYDVIGKPGDYRTRGKSKAIAITLGAVT